MPTVEESFDAALVSAREWAESGDRFNAWLGSKNEWVRVMSSKRIGATGERIVAGLFDGLGRHIQAPGTQIFDRHIDGWKVEVKTSTEWSGARAMFKFSQLRDTDYEVVALLGIRPESETLWVVPKAIIWDHAIGQHTGGKGLETRWITIDPDNVPAWLRPYGGTIEEGVASFATIAATRPTVSCTEPAALFEMH